MNKISLDVLISSLFSILAVLFNFWLIREAEFYLSAALLGTFMLIRRLAPTFSNLSQLGCSQALIRFISLNRDNEKEIKSYFFISIVIWLISNLILFLLYTFFSKTLITLLLPDIENRNSYLALTFVYISILHLSYLILPYFLNLRRILIYNIINVMNGSLIMLSVFLIVAKSEDLIEVLIVSLSVMAILQLLILGYIVLNLKLHKFPTKKILKKQGATFLKYGLPRAAMTFLEMFMLTVGSLIVKKDHELVGSFLIAITLARVVLIILQPISLLSSVIVGHNNDTDKPKKTLNLLFGGIIYSSSLVIIIMYNWIDVLIRFWLTKEDTIIDVVFVFKVLVFGLIPYCVFQGLKGFIEIKYFKPLNLFSIAIATFMHVMLFFILKLFYGILLSLSISLMIAFIIMGLLSYYWCRKDIKPAVYFKFIPLLVTTIFLFVVNYQINVYFPNMIGFVIGSLITITGFFAFVIFAKSKFVKDVLSIFKFTFIERLLK